MALLTVDVRTNAKYGTGSAPARGDSFGNLAVQQASGQYRDAVLRGTVFGAANQTSKTIGTTLTATMVTFALYNPTTSGKNLVVLDWAWTPISVTVTAGSAVIAINPDTLQAAPATNTAETIRNMLLGSAVTSAAAVYNTSTIAAAPVALIGLGFAQTGVGIESALRVPVQGALILGPNTVASSQGVTISLLGLGSAIWEEVAT